MYLKFYTLKKFWHPLVPDIIGGWINRRREKKWDEQREFIIMLAKETSYWALDRCKKLEADKDSRLVYGEKI